MAAVYYDNRFAYRGTASEKSVLTGMRDKDCYIEIDTGKIYFYNAATPAWVEFKKSGSSNSEAPAGGE